MCFWAPYKVISNAEASIFSLAFGRWEKKKEGIEASASREFPMVKRLFNMQKRNLKLGI